jgi:hypothetical protein
MYQHIRDIDKIWASIEARHGAGIFMDEEYSQVSTIFHGMSRGLSKGVL